MVDPTILDPLVPQREILWNVNSLSNAVIMYALFVVSVLIGLAGVVRRAETWATGKASPENTGRFLERFSSLFKWGVFQHGVNRDRAAVIFHSLIYFGFIVLLFTTIMVLIDHDLGIRIYHGNFYLAVT